MIWYTFRYTNERRCMKVIKVTDETHLRLKELATGSIGSYVEELLNKENGHFPARFDFCWSRQPEVEAVEDLLEQLVIALRWRPGPRYMSLSLMIWRSRDGRWPEGWPRWMFT